MIVVPFYTTRDLAPAAIARLPIHLMNPASVHQTCCGVGLPGRHTDDPQEVTCEVCLRMICLGLVALADALGALGAAWRVAHEKAVAAVAGPVPIDVAVSPEMRALVERMTHAASAERWALVEPTAGAVDGATHRVRAVPGLLAEVSALGGVALRLRVLQRDESLVTSYLMPVAVARWAYVDEATARGVATGDWTAPCVAYEPRLNGMRDECARCPFQRTEHVVSDGLDDHEGERRS